MAVKNKAFDHWIETSASDEISGSPWMRDLARHIFEAGQGASNEALRKRCEAVEADAARYRWLRDPDNYPDHDWWNDTLAMCDDGQSFDSAIDQAIAAAQEPSHG